MFYISACIVCTKIWNRLSVSECIEARQKNGGRGKARFNIYGKQSKNDRDKDDATKYSK